jgi:hypothetical protein
METAILSGIAFPPPILLIAQTRGGMGPIGFLATLCFDKQNDHIWCGFFLSVRANGGVLILKILYPFPFQGLVKPFQSALDFPKVFKRTLQL